MRRASTCLALLGLAMLAVSGTASAAPIVTLKAKAVPIPGFPHTGNILGAGAAEQAEYTIKSTEYGGFPPPIIGVNFFEPAGTKINSKGFPTCNEAALKASGPKGCPPKSKASIAGEGLGIVSFGSERVEEKASISAYFAPGGGLLFYVSGSSPVSLEFVSPGHFTNAGGLYGQELIATVPLIETVPGAPDSSTLSFTVTVGAAYKKGGKTFYYGMVPKKCPKGGFPLKSELMFAGLGGLSPQTVTTTYTAPCPRK
jgi:hypothetical protein